MKLLQMETTLRASIIEFVSDILGMPMHTLYINLVLLNYKILDTGLMFCLIFMDMHVIGTLLQQKKYCEFHV